MGGRISTLQEDALCRREQSEVLLTSKDRVNVLIGIFNAKFSESKKAEHPCSPLCTLVILLESPIHRLTASGGFPGAH
jgi:hypothetical protein